ncbi:hypothetical protein NOR_05487 [Metarhizium rileyi]|uniref:Uncharacterized protein n=1 Tax=Metarhizium rileyi (strain RCEF 4871) TaxID=1649241 RepID=A0A167CNY9_METRR|nr:hypothetical protein NOR_05487 [Metarhizium rileyi RCEF 4871]
MKFEFTKGTLEWPSFISVPPIPAIVSEWCALLPLVCHLATSSDGFLTVGEVSLLGQIRIPIVPMLGSLLGVSQLLNQSARYLDFAGVGARGSLTVWDVKWGSVFPAANGAAVAWICDCLKQTSDHPVVDVPKETSRRRLRRLPREGSTEDKHYKRGQTLRVHNFSFTDKPKESASFFRSPLARRMARYLWFLLSSLTIVFLFMLGTYGTACVLFCTTISQMVACKTSVTRPSTYLKNTELHDAAMLVAAHENSVEWQLFIGDREIVDTLLNKPMIEVQDGHGLASMWFEAAHALQLVAMTYVAAQKGWDGVLLLLLVMGDGVYSLTARGKNLARLWMEKEGVRATSLSFRFSGRTSMIGAIELFKGKGADTWMDTILIPHPRREAWLKDLRGHGEADDRAEGLDEEDMAKIKGMTEEASVGKEVLSSQFEERSLME